MAKIVCNTGPIIALVKIDRFELLQDLFETVVIPEAILQEIRDDVSLSALASARQWLKVGSVKDRLAVQVLQEDWTLVKAKPSF